MSEAARRILAELSEGGWDAVEELVTESREEGAHLDFKQKEEPDRPDPTRADRRNLSKALSGYANADGGIIVWGVDAREGEEGFDAAQGIVAIDNPELFAHRLDSLTPELAFPGIDGVEHTAVEDPNAPDTGVVVSLIPRSNRYPHRATGPDVDDYYRRSGHTFRRMDHGELADAFGRRPQPVLRADVSWRVGNRTERRGEQRRIEGELQVSFELAVESQTVVRYPCFSARERSEFGLRFRLGGALSRAINPINWDHRAAGGADVVFYPGDRYHVGSARTGIRVNLTTVQVGRVAPEDVFSNLLVEYSVVAAEAQPQEESLEVPGEEIFAALVDGYWP